MALNLNIPEVKDKPFIDAETRTNKISDALKQLASNGTLDFATHIRGELTVLNRQKVSVNARLQALNIYRSSIINTCQKLTQEFSNAPLPLHDKAKLAANAVEGLWQELGFGYKLALIDLQNQLISLSRKKDSIMAIQFAIHAIAEQLLTYFQTYRQIPESIWADFYQLYFCAVQMGVQHEAGDASLLNPWTNTSIHFSIESAFKHAMMMYLANPQNLAPKEMRSMANHLASQVHHANISAVTPLDTTYGAFIIDLGSNEAPAAYSKQKEQPNPHVDILLHSIELVRTIHHNLNALYKQLMQKEKQLSDYAVVEDSRRLMTHLIKHLGITPKRQFKRNRKIGELQLVAGITNTHLISGHIDADQTLSSSYQSHVLNNSHQTSSYASRWHIINMSATGMCIRRHATAEKNIKVGQLISFRIPKEHHWGMGVVRWAYCGNRDAVVIGVQFIAPFAQSAIASNPKRQISERALIFSDSPSKAEQTNLIVPRNTFLPGLQLYLQWGNEKHQVLCTRLIEQTQHYDRIQFKMLDNHKLL